jgi:pimeloyl-ACP methyl ester carboxylesterase
VRSDILAPPLKTRCTPLSRRTTIALGGASLLAAVLPGHARAASRTETQREDTMSDSNVTQASGKPQAFGPTKQINAGVLNVGYVELGPTTGPAVLLLHGWPYDIHSYFEVGPLLASRGCRVIVPHLRGHGTTRFLDAGAPRAGQQASIGADVIALMDALHIHRAVLAGYDWGGRAACVAAALWPERCAGLISVNSYLVQDIAKAGLPIAPKTEAAFWYQFYFLTERGRAGLTANRRDIGRIMWTRNSPKWRFDDATFERSAASFENPDYVDITIHSYRHRLGHARGYPQYEDLERRLAAQPNISVPTITIDGGADDILVATDGAASAPKFVGGREHRVIAEAGHNPPQETPVAFADAVWEVVSKRARYEG